jgi:serine protease AprX
MQTSSLLAVSCLCLAAAANAGEPAKLTRPESRILQCVDATGEIAIEEANFTRPQITSWHGMMTCCVAAGNGYMSDQLYRGIATKANLVLVKTGNPNGRGIREADIERALAWVIANRIRYQIRVVNISLGGDHPANGRLSELDRLVEETVDQGLVVVAAAGNEGLERLVPPASAPSAITVGGLDDGNTFDQRLWRMYHSNYGRGANARPKPDLVAPTTWLAAPMLPHTRVHREGMLLWQLLNEHGTRSYDQAVALLDELLNHSGVREVEEFEKFQTGEYIANYFNHTKPMVS